MILRDDRLFFPRRRTWGIVGEDLSPCDEVLIHNVPHDSFRRTIQPIAVALENGRNFWIN